MLYYDTFEADILKPTFFAIPLSRQSRALNAERSEALACRRSVQRESFV